MKTRMDNWRKQNRNRYNRYHLDYYFNHKAKINTRRKYQRYYHINKGELAMLIERTKRRLARMRKILSERSENA